MYTTVRECLESADLSTMEQLSLDKLDLSHENEQERLISSDEPAATLLPTIPYSMPHPYGNCPTPENDVLDVLRLVVEVEL